MMKFFLDRNFEKIYIFVFEARNFTANGAASDFVPFSLQ